MGYSTLNILNARSLVEGFARSNKKSLGQNFLLDDAVTAAIKNEALRFEPKHIFEIGPGAGSLTLEMLKTGLPCHCVEKDDRCVRYLKNAFKQQDNFTIVQGDALTGDLPDVVLNEDEEVVLVSNLPYNISTQIYFRMVDERLPLKGMVLMFQREVGHRFLAEPSSKAYGILSVLGQYYHYIEEVVEVPPESFKPAPKVHSVVLSFEPREPQLSNEEEGTLRKLVKSAFSTRRKTWVNTMAGFWGMSKDEWASLLNDLGINIKARAEDLSLENYLEIARRIHS